MPCCSTLAVVVNLKRINASEGHPSIGKPSWNIVIGQYVLLSQGRAYWSLQYALLGNCVRYWTKTIVWHTVVSKVWHFTSWSPSTRRWYFGTPYTQQFAFTEEHRLGLNNPTLLRSLAHSSKGQTGTKQCEKTSYIHPAGTMCNSEGIIRGFYWETAPCLYATGYEGLRNACFCYHIKQFSLMSVAVYIRPCPGSVLLSTSLIPIVLLTLYCYSALLRSSKYAQLL